jgi:hypothetical protein
MKLATAERFVGSVGSERLAQIVPLVEAASTVGADFWHHTPNRTREWGDE